MAIKNCKECGHQVSTKADQCPNCGAKRPTSSGILNIIFVFIIIISLFAIFYPTGNGDSEIIEATADGFSEINLNVRKGPSTDHGIISALDQGEKVRFISDSLGWYKIWTVEREEKVAGWVSSNYISDIEQYENWLAKINKKKEQERQKKLEQERREQEERYANTWKTTNNKFAAYAICERWVKRRLKAPSTAEFQDVTDGKYDNTFKNGYRYQITSYVDAQNSFGAQIRSGFTCVVEQVSREEWRRISLELDT